MHIYRVACYYALHPKHSCYLYRYMRPLYHRYASFPDSGYVNMIRHLCNISDGLCSIVEEPGEEEKVSLLSNAKCVIIPSDWSIIGSMESFGIVAVEALLSG